MSAGALAGWALCAVVAGPSDGLALLDVLRVAVELAAAVPLFWAAVPDRRSPTDSPRPAPSAGRTTR